MHGTSLYENNTLVSTDNKGMAAFLYENDVEPSSMPGNTTFVAGFVQCVYIITGIFVLEINGLDSERW